MFLRRKVEKNDVKQNKSPHELTNKTEQTK